MTENKATILVMISLILLLLAVFLQQHVKAIDRRYSLYNETDFFSSVIAGFKKLVAHECWIQADVYLHQGLMHEYDGKHDDERESFHNSYEEDHQHDHDHDVDHNHDGDECPFCGHHDQKEVKQNPFVPYNRCDFANTKHKTELNDKELLPWLRSRNSKNRLRLSSHPNSTSVSAGATDVAAGYVNCFAATTNASL